MSTSSIGSIMGATQSSASTTKSNNASLSMNDFFTLLSAQLKYQDPTSPTDNNQFMSQMAQFSLLEQVENLSKTVALSTATSAVGKSAVYTTTNSSGNTVEKSGKIAAVDLSGDTPEYYINNSWVSQSAITNFYDPDQFTT